MMHRNGKYNAKRTGQFDSIAEARRFQELLFLEKAGEISDLAVHPVYIIQEGFTDPMSGRIQAIKYEADFRYTENGRVVVEDVKGVETEAFKLKRKLFLRRMAGYGVDEFRIVKP